jgi:hypothetical protein
MGLLSWNMKIFISQNGCENILHNIMQGRPLPTMRAMKNVDPHKIQRLTINAMWYPKD